MSAQYLLLEEAAELDRSDARLTTQIEDLERRLVDARRQRDDVRFHRAECLAAAQALDGIGVRVDRDEAGLVTVAIDWASEPGQT